MTFLEKEYQTLLELGSIDNSLYEKYNVKRGLRNENGTGVLVGLTKVSDVQGYRIDGNTKVPAEGHLYYRDIDLYALAEKDDDSDGFEKTIFLLLFAHLPSREELDAFKEILRSEYFLPDRFVESVIFNNPSNSLMNNLQKSILSLYSFDKDADSLEPMEMVRKGISLIAKMPAIISYSYQAKKHYIDKQSLHVHYIDNSKNLSELILHLIRPDNKYTKLEAETLDTCLIVHADHGGGNNSTFTNVVVSSTGTDIYSDISAGLGSLKGPRHGGASKMVREMMDAIVGEIGLDATDEEIGKIVERILDKDFFDKTGLVYGIGHAVYTLSDPRAILLKEKCKELSEAKGSNRFQFFERLERIAVEKVYEKKGKICCANVDFYSGLTYHLLDIPRELYTPLFAAARISGWVAHIIETNLYCDKIIRPASKYVGKIEE